MKKIILIVLLLVLAGVNYFSPALPSIPAGDDVPVVEDVKVPEYYVFVTGAVRKPGLYAFTEAVTIGDAVHAAGDALPYADAAAVNFAQPITDGLQVHIPYDLNGAPAAAAEAGKVNINEADEKAFTDLPGIGPSMAKQIIAYRDEHGPFKACEELQKVKGIGPAKYEKIKDKVSL